MRTGIGNQRAARPTRRGVEALCALGALAVTVSPAFAAVDLEWRPQPLSVSVAQVFDLGVYAVSDDGSDQGVSAVDLVLSWDPSKLVLIKDNDDGDYDWMLSGFQGDSQADGLNDSFADGNAFYQAIANFSSPAVASDTGLKITSFRFEAIGKADLASVEIVAGLGTYSRTHVFMAGAVNVDIKGNLGMADLEVLGKALLRIPDVSIPAGRTAGVVVVGEIDDRSTFGVEITVEIKPRPGAEGAVAFTPAGDEDPGPPPEPPPDIVQVGDPWPGTGSFTVADTDLTYLPTVNGSADDNGLFLPEGVTYSGPLTMFPVVADTLAAGEWDLMLTTTRAEVSTWTNLESVQIPGTLRVVALGDGDGSLGIDARDYAELASCFTGPGPGDGELLFSQDPSARCGVYDFDNDGDVDWEDYAAFHAVLTGPAAP